MAYIYKITNDVNGKMYVGKTEFSIEKRFKEHIYDRKRRAAENRPLYRAMNKYGPEHFHIELIEETDNPEEREVYWIEKLGTFKDGYNASIGGDGKRYLDYDLIAATYAKTNNTTKTAELCECDPASVRTIAIEYNIYDPDETARRISQLNKDRLGKKCCAIDKKTNEVIKTFASYMEGAVWVLEQNKDNFDENNKIPYKKISGAQVHISEVCRGKRKTAYGYKWENL